MIAGSPTAPWTLKILPEMIAIAVLVPVEEFDVMLDWLNSHEPQWRFNYGGDREKKLNWYRKMATEHPYGELTWHLLLSKPVAMMARLTRDTYLVKNLLTT